MTARPIVGVGVIVVRDGLVLVGQRIGSHGAGSWALPGGHLESGESPEQCAKRELLEEAALTLGPSTRGPFTSDLFVDEDKHYVTLFVVAGDAAGQPVVREPDRCLGWQWVRWFDLTQPAFQPLFQPLATLHASGYVPPGTI